MELEYLLEEGQHLLKLSLKFEMSCGSLSIYLSSQGGVALLPACVHRIHETMASSRESCAHKKQRAVLLLLKACYSQRLVPDATGS